jgi:hypothetical protein
MSRMMKSGRPLGTKRRQRGGKQQLSFMAISRSGARRRDCSPTIGMLGSIDTSERDRRQEAMGNSRRGCLGFQRQVDKIPGAS